MANNFGWSYHYSPPCSGLDYYGIAAQQYQKRVLEFYSDSNSDIESESGEEEEQSDEEDLLSFDEDEQNDEDLLSFSEEEEERHTVKEIQAKNSSVLMPHIPTNQDVLEVAVQQQSNQELLNLLNSSEEDYFWLWSSEKRMWSWVVVWEFGEDVVGKSRGNWSDH